LLIEFYRYLPIHVYWCWISAAVIYSFIIRNCQIIIFLFLNNVVQWSIYLLISVMIISRGLALLVLICFWIIVIGCLNYKRVISTRDVLILSTDEHLVILKKLLILQQKLEYPFIWNLKKRCNNRSIYRSTLIQNLLNSVLWYWRAV
jgi:hypothetical protein